MDIAYSQEANGVSTSTMAFQTFVWCSTFVVKRFIGASHPLRYWIWSITLISFSTAIDRIPLAENIALFLRPYADYLLNVLLAAVAIFLPGLQDVVVEPSVKKCSLKGKGKEKGNPLNRSYTSILKIISSLPGDSNKYNFAKEVAEKSLQMDTEITPDILYSTRRALYEHFDDIIHELEVLLGRQKYSKDLKNLFRFFPGANNTIDYDSERAQKLAKELLWMTKQLRKLKGLEDVAMKWSEPLALSPLSLSSSIQVRASLVQISSVVFRKLVSFSINLDQDASFNLLKQWIPLFCLPLNSADGFCLSYKHMEETKNALIQAIERLDLAKQEEIYAIWLKEYSFSDSDWPNLSEGYYDWLKEERKKMLFVH